MYPVVQPFWLSLTCQPSNTRAIPLAPLCMCVPACQSKRAFPSSCLPGTIALLVSAAVGPSHQVTSLPAFVCPVLCVGSQWCMLVLLPSPTSMGSSAEHIRSDEVRSMYSRHLSEKFTSNHSSTLLVANTFGVDSPKCSTLSTISLPFHHIPSIGRLSGWTGTFL